jgi:segregation and condensation protein A
VSRAKAKAAHFSGELSGAGARKRATTEEAAAAPVAFEPGAPAFENQYRVELPEFEGPLDLLLHLIQQHELDILDIPVSFITSKYLGYLDAMRTMAIDVASEYLVMAATLTHIKSKMLLPVVPKGQEEDGLPGEEEDPRAELVRRLLEYQKYKAAALNLGERSALGRDVFPRGASEPVPETAAPFAEVGVFALFDAFDKLLKRTNVRLDHEVAFDRISITDRILELTDRLSVRRSIAFDELFSESAGPLSRFDIVITFLALLEMCRMNLTRIYQSGALAPIHIELVPQDGDDAAPPVDESATPNEPEAPSVSEGPDSPVADETP